MLVSVLALIILRGCGFGIRLWDLDFVSVLALGVFLFWQALTGRRSVSISEKSLLWVLVLVALVASGLR